MESFESAVARAIRIPRDEPPLLDTVIDKLLVAVEPSAQLDAAIILALGQLGQPTRYIDDALKLVPQGYTWTIATLDTVAKEGRPGWARTYIFAPATVTGGPWHATSRTPAIAVCLAALQCRKAIRT